MERACLWIEFDVIDELGRLSFLPLWRTTLILRARLGIATHSLFHDTMYPGEGGDIPNTRADTQKASAFP